MDIQIKSLYRANFGCIKCIHDACFPHQNELDEDELAHDLKDSCRAAYCLNLGSTIVGYIVYSWDQVSATVEQLAVEPCNQRNGYGMTLLSVLHKKWEQRNEKIKLFASVPDDCYAMQKMLAKAGWRVYSMTSSGTRDDPDEPLNAAHNFEFVFDGQPAKKPYKPPTDRLSGLKDAGNAST